MRRHRTSLGITPVPDAAAPSGTSSLSPSPCTTICKPAPTIWTHLDHIGAIASAVSAFGIVWALMRGKSL